MKKLIIGYILGILSCIAVVVIAESIQSNEVLYDNSNSSSNSENVQEALDNLYNIVDHSNVGFSLLERNPSKLSTQLVGGLYRYQGVQDANNNVDNYICFGTTNKSDCISDTDKYMYRIIGINTNGQMKLIKKEALNTTYLWGASGNNWPNTSLFSGLNGSYFLTNTTYIPDNSWSNRIMETEWHYGDITIINVDPATMYTAEMSTPTINAKIGLMYLHDYYYGQVGCSISGGYSTCKTSWFNLSKNDPSAPNVDYEWTIMRQNGSDAFIVRSDGLVCNYHVWYNYSVRPVFFLRASERIASGSGTLTDPYILS